MKEHTPSYQQIIYIAVFLVIFIFLIILHGALPLINAPGLSIQAPFVGITKCLANSEQFLTITCDKIGYPIGFRVIYGYPIYFFMVLLNKYLAIPPIDGLQLFNIICIFIGSFSVLIIVKKLAINPIAAFVSVIIFYASPFMFQQGYGPLYQGFLLYPFYITSSLYLFSRISKKIGKSRITELAFLFLVQSIVIFIAAFVDGYSYVMVITTIAVIGTIYLINSYLRTNRFPLKLVFMYIAYTFLLIVPGVVYKMIAFDESIPTQSLDYFRGEGIDLMTMLIPIRHPIRGLLFAKLFHLGPLAWNAYAFYGDGNNTIGNFVGIISLTVGIISIYFALVKDKTNSKLIYITLGIIWVIGFMFSLGPSLKFNSTRESIVADEITSDYYIMPPEEAVITLPTEFLFRLPVITSMRATYRWQLISRFALAALVGLFIARMLQKRHILAILLALLVTIENLPVASLEGQRFYQDFRKQGETFNSEVFLQLQPYVSNSRILFLPAGLDYLVPLMVPSNSYTYNVGFDKELWRIRQLQPQPVLRVIDSFDKGILTEHDLCRLFNKNFVDKVVFTYFDLRWDSYTWPPSNQRVTTYQQKVESLNLDNVRGITLQEAPLFLVVSRDPKFKRCSTPQ